LRKNIGILGAISADRIEETKDDHWNEPARSSQKKSLRECFAPKPRAKNIPLLVGSSVVGGGHERHPWLVPSAAQCPTVFVMFQFLPGDAPKLVNWLPCMLLALWASLRLGR
jgi:hypothetical protein